VPGTSTLRPRKLSVVSVVTQGPVAADRFGQQGGNYWQGNLAELIIYDRSLSSSERKLVEGYLISKYRVQVIDGQPTPVSAPMLAPAGGVFVGTTTVTMLSVTPGARIYFTRNGDDPTESSEEYTATGVELSGTTTLAVRAFKEGYAPSDVVRTTFYAQADAVPLAVTGATDGSYDGSLKLWWRIDAGLPSQHGDFWADQSGDHNHGIQVDSAATARATQDVTTGSPVLHFDGGDFVQFTQSVAARTVFWVVSEDVGVGDYRPLLGPTGWLGGHSYGGGNPAGSIWCADCTSTSQSVRSGSTWLNGQPVSGTSTLRPRKLSVVSVVTQAPVAADRFGQQGGYYWQGNLAELIIYDVPLSDAQVRDVEDYLNAKYGLFPQRLQ
jgi:hypothetical protein